MASLKRKRKVLTIAQKLEICNEIGRGQKPAFLSSKYDVGVSTIYDIKAQKNDLLKFYAKSESSKAAEERKTLRVAKFDELDTVLYEWFVNKRSTGTPISGPMLIEKAQHFYELLEMTEPLTFSSGWLTRFKQRHGIRRLDVVGEKKSADDEAAETYKETFSSLVNEHGLSAEQIFNADETGLWWRCLPRSTLAGGSENSAEGFKQSKDRITVLTCANAAGTKRIKLLVIGKYRKPRAFKNVRGLPVEYAASPNAWMNGELFKNWFFNLFVPEVKAHFRRIRLPEDSKCVLLLDNCKAHPPESVLQCGNIFTRYLPPNVTSLIQPMDQGVIENMKTHYRKQFLRKLVNAEMTTAEFQRQYTIKDTVFNIAAAWNMVKESTLRKAWRKLWAGVAFIEGSSDEEDFEGFTTQRQTSRTGQIVRELVSISTDAEGDMIFTEIELQNWCAVDDDLETERTFGDEELMQAALGNFEKEKDVSSDEEEVPDDKGRVTWDEAAKALDVFVKFVEKRPCYTAQEVVQVQILQDQFFTKRQGAKVQLQIDEAFKRSTKRSGTDIIVIDDTPTTEVD